MNAQPQQAQFDAAGPAPEPTGFAAHVPPEKIEWHDGFPLPPTQPVRPVHALVSVIRLIRNKEDTRQVFETVQALAGSSGKKLFKKFAATPYGRRVVSEPVRLEKILSDRDWLRAMPEGSLGRVYLAFMEGENLTPEGLLGAAAEAGIDYECETQFEEFRRLFLHLSVSHDLWHVLTGYGRDALGELCNLAFTYQQTRNPGFRLIIAIGLLAQKREAWRAPLIRAVMEGRRIGKGADFILKHDVEALLPLPLAEARAKLGIAAPEIYNSVPADLKAGLLQPKVKETQAEREAKALAA
ncbi:MAG: Coq4 family protein [Pseudomonadota bacterium]|nr:Coq4 family protein [Pseudomonadota bacterium]